MGRWLVAVLMMVAMTAAYGAEVTMKKVAYEGWSNCIQLSNGAIELVATTDVGPRIIRFGFIGGQNLFKEYKETLGQTGGTEWNIYGGHRLWHAPEAKPRTYALDNSPIKYEWDGKTLKLIQPTEPETRIQKEIELTLEATSNSVRILHRLINRNPWEVELAPWSLTVMAQGGRAIFPQEPFIRHEDKLLPARPMVLWHYTNMADPRWSWGARYVQLRQDPSRQAPQKIGLLNSLGWAAYALNGEVFVKRYAYQPDATYPDFGCNTETFTNADMLEVETVGPLTKLTPDGGAVEHVEQWYLFKADIAQDEPSIDRQLMPLLRQTQEVR